MKKNEGRNDRIIRAVSGVVILVIAVVLKSVWLGIVSLILLITAATGFCGLYALFKIDTGKNEKCGGCSEEEKRIEQFEGIYGNVNLNITSAGSTNFL